MAGPSGNQGANCMVSEVSTTAAPRQDSEHFAKSVGGGVVIIVCFSHADH
jgi:hypothetical protein